MIQIYRSCNIPPIKARAFQYGIDVLPDWFMSLINGENVIGNKERTEFCILDGGHWIRVVKGQYIVQTEYGWVDCWDIEEFQHHYTRE